MTFDNILSIGTILASCALVYLTWVLAKATKLMADRSSAPHVIATLEPNQWSVIHFDLHVSNAGNAVAYDVEVQFTPELPSGNTRGERRAPFSKVSVLRPGAMLSSYVCEYEKIKETDFEVTISWAHQPGGKPSSTAYTFSTKVFENISYIGERNPHVQSASELKKLREEWRRFLSGGRKMKIDVYTHSDRERTSRLVEEHYENELSKKKNQEPDDES